MNDQEKTTPHRTGVCIVGGGPAGMLLGLLLAKRGADVIVLEQHNSFDREFRGEVLQPSTARLLDQIGLLGYIMDQPHLTLTEGKLLVNGEPKAGFSFKTIAPDYPYAIWMPQVVFLNALLEKARPFAGFHCWMGAHVKELIEENGSVVGVRGVSHGETPFEIRADVVVGADGRFSSIRRLGKFDVEYEHHDFDMIWFVVDPPADWSKTIYISMAGVPLLLLPKHPNLVQAGLVLDVDEWKSWRSEGIDSVAKRIRGLSPLFAQFAQDLRDFTPFVPLTGIILLVRDWARNGLLLIGDAAHTMSPAGAIGVNVALATAAVAAQEIYPQLGHGPIPKTALDRVQELRIEDVKTIHRLQRIAGRAILGAGSRNRVLRWLVPRVLPIAVRAGLLPALQRRIFFGAPLPPLDPAFGFFDEKRAA